MKRLKTMILDGRLEELEEVLVIENDLAGIGWKVEDFKIISDDFTEAQDNTYVARLATSANIDPNTAQFQRNDILGISTYGGGNSQTILDEVSIVTDELYVTNCTKTATITNKEICYQIILGQYSISDLEQVVAQVKVSQG